MRKVFAEMIVIVLLVSGGWAQTREQTTIQTTHVDLGKVKDAVTFSYLNLPWGEKSFSYIEHGTKDSYYGERTWPFAQMDTKVPLSIEGTKLEPGQYALIITPGAENKSMTLSVVKFEGATFLKPGNIFAPTPKGTSLYTKDVGFPMVDDLVDHMKIDVPVTKKGFDMVVNYGNRKLVKSFQGK